MARRSRSSDKGPLWHGYRRPVWRDGVFWLAFGTAIVGLVVQNAFANFEATTSGWVILGIEVVFTFAVSFALIGVVAGTVRGFGEGWRQAEKAAPPRGPAARPAKAKAEPEPEHVTEPATDTATGPTAGPTTPAAAEPMVEVVPPAAADEPGAPTVGTQPRPEPEPVVAAASDGEPPDRPKAGIEMERHARRLGRAIGAGRRTYKKYDKD